MTVTIESFKEDFDEFGGVPDAKVRRAMERAARCMDQSEWGQWYDDGLSYLTAYHLEKAGLVGSEGEPNAPEMAGQTKRLRVEKQYEVEFFDSNTPQTTFTKSTLNSSAYGREFLELQRTAVSLTVGFF